MKRISDPMPLPPALAKNLKPCNGCGTPTASKRQLCQSCRNVGIQQLAHALARLAREQAVRAARAGEAAAYQLLQRNGKGPA